MIYNENISRQGFLWYLNQDENFVIVLSREGIIRAINPAGSIFLGGEPGFLCGQNYFDVVEKLKLEPVFELTDLNIKDKKELRSTFANNGDQGTQVIEWSLEPLIDDSKAEDVYILVGKNIPKMISNEEGHYQTIEEYTNSIKHYFETIIACMPGNVYWMDTNSVYLGCNDNAAKTFGFASRNGIVGKTYEDMAKAGNWKANQGESFRRDDIEVVKTGKPKLNVEEPPITDIHGNILYFLTSRVPIFDRNNKVIGVVGISIEISERKKMEDSLKEAKERAEAANKAKTEFLENMRHDIRTPLSGIVGLSGLLNGETDKNKIRKFTASLAEASNELLRFLNEVLESINVASGDLPMVKKKFSLV